MPLFTAVRNSVLVIDLPDSKTEPYLFPIIKTKISASFFTALMQFSAFDKFGLIGKPFCSERIGLCPKVSIHCLISFRI